MKYAIYCGLSGGFGGASFDGFGEYENEEEACSDAYQRAIEEYKSYAGLHGILDWEDVREENPDLSEDDIDSLYLEEIEGWIDYYAIKIPENMTEEEWLAENE